MKRPAAPYYHLEVQEIRLVDLGRMNRAWIVFDEAVDAFYLVCYIERRMCCSCAEGRVALAWLQHEGLMANIEHECGHMTVVRSFLDAERGVPTERARGLSGERRFDPAHFVD